MRSKGWIAAGLVAVALAGTGTAGAQTAADLAELQRLSDERGEERGRFLRSKDGRSRAPSPGTAPPEVIRPLAGVWVCAGAEANDKVYAAPSVDAPVMGRTMPYVATRGVRQGPFLEVLHTNGDIGFVLLDGVTDGATGRLLPYVPPEGVAARQCTVAGVRAHGGTLVFRFQ